VREVLEREAELAAFDRLLGAADGGSGSVVLVTGEAGVGKTALARAFAERSVSRRVAVGWCERVSAAIPFGPLHDLAATLGDPLRAALAQDSGLARVAGALLTALARPTLAIVEDIHWADTLTLDALQIAGRRIDMVPSVLVITFRDDEAARGARALAGRVRATRLAPAPLSAETVDRLAARSGVDGARLMRATGGNPFLVEESLAAPEGVPATVHDAIVARTAPLSADARGALDVSPCTASASRRWRSRGSCPEPTPSRNVSTPACSSPTATGSPFATSSSAPPSRRRSPRRGGPSSTRGSHAHSPPTRAPTPGARPTTPPPRTWMTSHAGRPPARRRPRSASTPSMRRDECELAAHLAAVGTLLRPPPAGTPGPFALSEPGALRALVADAGFTAATVADTSAAFVYPDEPTALRALLSSGPCVRAIDVAGEPAVRHAIADSITAYREPGGSYHFANVWRFAICRRD
jgi:hypothetical protein